MTIRTVKKTDHAMLVQRPSGFAVAVRTTEWSEAALRNFFVWKTIAKGLTAADAQAKFDALPC